MFFLLFHNTQTHFSFIHKLFHKSYPHAFLTIFICFFGDYCSFFAFLWCIEKTADMKNMLQPIRLSTFSEISRWTTLLYPQNRWITIDFPLFVYFYKCIFRQNRTRKVYVRQSNPAATSKKLSTLFTVIHIR